MHGMLRGHAYHYSISSGGLSSLQSDLFVDLLLFYWF